MITSDADMRGNRVRPMGAVVARQAGFDLRLLLRNGEQLLLTVVIPVALLVGLSTASFIELELPAGADSRVEGALPGVLALAVLSTAFTALAISTGFDRRSGALKFLGTTPVQRPGLIGAKVLSSLAVVALQAVVLVAVAAGLGWRASAGLLPAALLIALGTAAFSALALALAGTLRAEATLAVANGLFLLLMFAGGVVVPASAMPDTWAAVVSWLPSAALADGLRGALLQGGLPVQSAVVLVAWGVVGAAVARATFRWD